MDIIDLILSTASEIYKLVDNVKANKKRCVRVADRVKALEALLRSIQQRRTVQRSPEVDKGLHELSITIVSAQELIRTYASAKWVERVLKSSSHGDEFISVNERLNDAFQLLSGALQLEQNNTLVQVFEMSTRLTQDQKDGAADDTELKEGEGVWPAGGAGLRVTSQCSTSC